MLHLPNLDTHLTFLTRHNTKKSRRTFDTSHSVTLSIYLIGTYAYVPNTHPYANIHTYQTPIHTQTSILTQTYILTQTLLRTYSNTHTYIHKIYAYFFYPVGDSLCWCNRWTIINILDIFQQNLICTWLIFICQNQ